MPYKGEGPLFMTMAISLSGEILTFLRALYRGRHAEKSFAVLARSAFAMKQSDNLFKSLKARLLHCVRNDLPVVSAIC
jgi:hypothetical protein